MTMLGNWFWRTPMEKELAKLPQLCSEQSSTQGYANIARTSFIGHNTKPSMQNLLPKDAALYMLQVQLR
eukprot:CAMPEP_0172746852 /NCGR_PEP_ID=MMETSP1074-20121228/141523_1 /TAXON_ID=2916 /ORGANISM="Ceratium fusus, Strain PA161109" /LENGTH=68 /DNA_ID=CAMNT_0013578283 /DNA_START=15 /DNA_END=218 /DNA_ORIENTATION=-